MIILKDKIYVSLSDLTPVIWHSIQEDMRITNPLWLQAKKMELTFWGKDQFLKFYKKEKDQLILPSGYINALLNKWVDNKRPDFIDKRFENKNTLNLEFKGKLRPFQQTACDVVMTRSFGVIQAPTGAGKTVMMIYLIAKRQQPTIVLVDQIELGDQFVERVKQFTDLKNDDIGFIGNGKFSIKPLTIALLQSMHRLDDKYYEVINQNIGQIFCDEVHIVAAETYYDVMSRMKAKYKFGFSATPKRVDGLTEVIFWATGPIIHDIPFTDVSIISKPDVNVFQTEYKFPLISVREYGDMVSDLSIDEDRNNLIVKTLTQQKYKDLQKVLLCTRISQVLELHLKLKGSDILISGVSKEDKKYFINRLGEKKAKLLFKKVSKKHRKQIIEDLHSGKLNTIISTYGLFSKGIDIKTLQLLAFCAPIRSEVIVKQCRGRVMRKIKDKVPVVIDFEDKNVELLRWQAKQRQYYLKEFD